MDVAEFVVDVAWTAADEIEVACLPEMAGETTVALDYVAGLKFPMVHYFRKKLVVGEEE